MESYFKKLLLSFLLNYFTKAKIDISNNQINILHNYNYNKLYICLIIV